MIFLVAAFVATVGTFLVRIALYREYQRTSDRLGWFTLWFVIFAVVVGVLAFMGLK